MYIFFFFLEYFIFSHNCLNYFYLVKLGKKNHMVHKMKGKWRNRFLIVSLKLRLISLFNASYVVYCVRLYAFFFCAFFTFLYSFTQNDNPYNHNRIKSTNILISYSYVLNKKYFIYFIPSPHQPKNPDSQYCVKKFFRKNLSNSSFIWRLFRRFIFQSILLKIGVIIFHIFYPL
jgi:hypothetical protein